jgi:predicted PurR-regulated permease PerM
MDESGHLLQRWLVGKFFSMFAIGSLSIIGLSIIDVQPALALGLLAGILAFIPYIGPILSSVPAIILGFAKEPISGVYVIAVFFVVQIIESNLITPFIERRSVWLPPAFTIFMQVLFTILFGFLGVLLASPLAAVTLLFVKKLYVEDVLEAST